MDFVEVKRAGAGRPTPKCAPGGVELEKITVDDPKLQGNALSKYYTYCVTTVPTFPGVLSVRRRYSDFEWLRGVLVTMFVGVVVPPLPPKKAIGNMEEAFIKERAEGLARFLNRIRKIHYFANTEAFYFFLSKHENSFEGAKKEVSKNIKSGDQISPLELVSRYSELFPDAVGREFGFDLEEGILRLKTCWERTDVELKNICKKLQSTINCLSIIGEDANSIATSTANIRTAENEYAQRPDPKRLDVVDPFADWSRVAKNVPDMYKNLLLKYSEEVDDLEAFMEALKARDALKAVYLKHKARSDKWKALPTDPRVEDIPKMEQDMKNEEEFGKALQVVTKVILGHQLPHSWHEKVTSYSLAIQDFSKDYLDKAEALKTTFAAISELASGTSQI